MMNKNISGWFRWTVLLALLACRAGGADVTYYGIVKTQRYLQTNTSDPSLLASNAWLFSAFVESVTNNVVTNATVTPAGKPTRQLLLNTNGVTWRYEYETNTQGQLDGLFSSTSNYTLTNRTVNDGTRVVVLSWAFLGAPVDYPALVKVSNFQEAQSIDHTKDFRLNWTFNAAADAYEILQLTVTDSAANTVFSSPRPYTAGAMNGLSNTTVIPAYTLSPGSNYMAHLTFARPAVLNIKTNDYPGATGVPAMANDTAFALKTRPAPPPQITVLPRLTNQFKLRLQGETNRLYHIQASTDFQTWTNLFTTNTATGVFDFTDPRFTNANRRFYRARMGQ